MLTANCCSGEGLSQKPFAHSRFGGTSLAKPTAKAVEDTQGTQDLSRQSGRRRANNDERG
ncbi:MAG: hypothetical protein LBS01_11905 [Prevotellaceae bacterium]|nr:hypothetical protein [Prevotellaceae bacterium]